MRVIIVRHAATRDNEENLISGSGRDQSLSKHGLIQAHKLSWALWQKKISMVYTSPLIRAMRTSLQIRKQHIKAGEAIVPELTERACGVLEGTPIGPDSPFAKACAAAVKPFGYFAPEGGESLMQVQERVLRFFNTLYEKHSMQSIVLVSSGAAIAMLMLGILKKEVTAENYRALKHSNAGYSELFFSSPEECQVLCLNCVNHL